MDILEINKKAWNNEVRTKNPWTIPVSSETIAAARKGDWQIVLTPTKPVPADWYPALQGADVLCLASGGGQQGPIMAAVGARVTVLDNSPDQLAQDRIVAERDGLDITLVEGDMADLSMFANGSFDLIIHPVSNIFVPDVNPVWREAYRVLRPGGVMLSGLCNPAVYLFEVDVINDVDTLNVIHKIPYSDLEDLDEETRQNYIKNQVPFEFSHTLEDLIGGQIRAGFVITGLFEDGLNEKIENSIFDMMDCFIATRAEKR